MPGLTRTRRAPDRLRGVAARSMAALVAGLLLFGSFPPRPFWFLAPVGIAVLTATVRGADGLRGGFGYGMLAGLGFFVPLLPWTGIYVGPLPWLALSTTCALYLGLFGLLANLIGRLPWWPLWVALAWVTTEWIRSSFPFGGFPWGRLAFGQADGWFLSLAAVGGAPLIGFAVALTGTGLAALVERLAALRTTGAPGGVVADDESKDAAGARNSADELSGGGSAVATKPRVGAASRAGIITAAATLVIMPIAGVLLRSALPAPDEGDGTITVAAIQGSVPRLGLDFNAQRRAVLDNHVRRTEQLAEDVAAGRARKPDVVIWPENSSDIDPLRNADAAALITRASEAIDAPILVGAVLVNGDRTTTNSVMVWNGAEGPADRHDKKIIQPFGEYLPLRSFFRLFSEYADRAGYFVPGDGDGTVRAAGVDIGVATCYEVAFDRAFRDSLRSGAQLLTVPTNNATFGDSEMTYQQLAMSRVRAVEHGRALVVAATSGVSAIVTADGAVPQQTELFVPAALVADLPLRNSITLATRIGAAPEWVSAILTAAAVVVALSHRRRSRSVHATDQGFSVDQSVG
ncbi:apolipoprotein N-acyltransferase [Nocardia amikacinitolerans]|uniref:Apolipoprotein N-acyltransferase n=1 Tax=Nocardia amikacinitolerans TaxID=756689 RepID=A0A285L2U2_9NOCA|nr:apolipoprotein N-acyltransferase [Nocardia amikacinitolerans]MCP2296578.1 apolipoprotein N-acyltransferase [Nocardia amikacinitolerans]SNY79252.1 apolipoprotein N-acyltransferase [Nocardia amikacinitolerans]